MYPQFRKIVDISPSSYKRHVHVSFNNELQPVIYDRGLLSSVSNSSTKARIFLFLLKITSHLFIETHYNVWMWPLTSMKVMKDMLISMREQIQQTGWTSSFLHCTRQFGWVQSISPVQRIETPKRSPLSVLIEAVLCQLIKEGCVVQEWISVSPLPSM